MYDLHALGWSSFQQLCLTITREILGQTVESFLDSDDGGRDGAFRGTWRATGQEELIGSFVIQCKFTSRRDHSLQLSELDDEVDKASRLASKGLCNSYVLMTNAGLSGTRAEDIKALLQAAGVKHVATFGSTWINQQIRENKRLRMLVPRVYGLGDLSQILDERAYRQARAILESMREDLAKVVATDAYPKAAAAQGIPSLALRAPSGMPWAEVEESLITEDFITAAMSEYYLWSLNCRRQMFRVTLAQGVGLLYSESYYDKAHAMP